MGSLSVKSKFKIVLRVLVLIIATCTIMHTPVYASTSTEHSFGYNHPTISYYNAFTNTSYSLPGLNTYTGDAATIHTKLDNIGYYNAYSFQNNSASIVQNCIGSDAIFYISAHGSSGRVICVNGNSTSAAVSYLAANSTGDNMSYSLQNKYQNTTNKLKYVKFAFFNCCYSANTSSTYGNLLNMSYTLGVDCSLGFTDTVQVNTGAFFANRVLSYYGGDYNNTVSGSCISAKRDTFNQYGLYGGVDSYKLVGNSNITIAPASYGTY